MRKPPEFRLEGELTNASLAEWPVWAEFSDIREWELIVSWGVARTRVEQAFEIARQSFWDQPYFPVQVRDRRACQLRLNFRATFVTAAGHRLEGYLIGDGTNAAVVFVGSRRIALNRAEGRKAGLDEPWGVEALRSALGGDVSQPVLPLSFEAARLLVGAETRWGVFAP